MNCNKIKTVNKSEFFIVESAQAPSSCHQKRELIVKSCHIFKGVNSMSSKHYEFLSFADVKPFTVNLFAVNNFVLPKY